MAIARIGRYRTTADVDVAEIGHGQQRACIYDYSSDTLIVYRLGGWFGKDTSTPSVRIGIGEAGGGGTTPGELLAYSDQFTPSTVMDSGDPSSGGSHTDDITPILVGPGYYALVATVRDGVLGIGMRQSSGITAHNENFYTKSGVGSTVPTDPIGGTATNNGHLDLWAEGEVNEAPSTPGSLAPTGTISASTLTPTFTSTFSDVNTSLPNGATYDRLTRVHVQVRRVSDGVLFWNYEYAASSGEYGAATASKVYAGTALVAGTAYEQRVRHADRALAWSSWTSWTAFTISSAGSVAQPSSPSSKQDTVTPGPFVATWSHASSASTNAVQVQLLTEQGTVIATSPIISKTVANNAAISITWAESTFASLTYATTYRFQIRGRDTSNVWSAYSPNRLFYLNTAPTVPTDLSPNTTSPRTALPVLRCRASDVDALDQPPTVKARIKNSGGTVLFTRTMTYNSTKGVYEYQTTSTDMATFATYKWDAYSFDGQLYSGTTTVEASAAKSIEATIVYSAGPSVSITSPADLGTITTSTPTITWTETGQTAYLVELRELGGTVRWSIGGSSTTINSATIPPGNWANNETLVIAVQVTDVSLLTSTDTATVTLDYTDITAPALSGYGVSFGSAANTHAMMLTWPQSTYAIGEFVEYTLYRTELAADAFTFAGPTIILRHITSPIQVAYLDADIKSGVSYFWLLTETHNADLDTLVSEGGVFVGSVNFDGVALHLPLDPQMHLEMRWGQPGRTTETRTVARHSMRLVEPPGSRTRRVIFGPQQSFDPSGTFRLRDDDAGTADEKLEALKGIIAAQMGDETTPPRTVCWRIGADLHYVVLDEPTIDRRNFSYQVELKGWEVAFQLGETE